MIAILLFAAAVIVGSVLADRLLTGGRSADLAAVQNTLALGRLVGLPVVLLSGVLVLFHLYTSSYAFDLVVFAVAVAAVCCVVARRNSGSAWVYVSHALPAALAIGLLGTEAMLASAAAGGLPSRYPAAWNAVAGARAIPAIVGGLHHPSSEVRLSAVEELEHGMTLEDAHAVCAVTGDPEENIRAQAVGFLSRLSDEQCIPALEKATLDPAQTVRQSALTGLVQIRSPRAFLPIVRAQVAHDRTIEEARRKDPKNGRRALGNSTPGYTDADLENTLRDRNNATEYLARLVKDGSGAPDDADLRTEAVLMLGQVGDKDALPALLPQTRNESPTVRGNAATALARLASRSRVQQAGDWIGIWGKGGVAVSDTTPPLGIDCRSVERELIRLTRDPDESVRARALKGLAAILRRNYMWGGENLDTFDPDSRMQALNGPEVQAAASRALHDPNPEVRNHALTVMGEIGDHRAIPLLLQLDKTSPSPYGCEYCGLLKGLGVTGLAHQPAVPSLNVDVY